MFISNNNYAKISNFVFAETVGVDNFKSLKNDNLKIIYQNNKEITYKSNILEITDGDVIYCKTDYIDELFYNIRSSNFKNLKLITHQADISIDKKLIYKLPKNFTHWYAINKNADSINLNSIPIGLAGNFSEKNLHIKDFKNLQIPNFDLNAKKKKVYINFKKNTNTKERNKAIEDLKNFDNAFFSEPNLSKDEYKTNLQKFAFVLCPWGNGFDTHRIWEALYSGSIPIVKRHYAFEYLDDLPVLFINDYTDLYNLDLEQYINEFDDKQYNYDKLFLNYWIELFECNNTNIKRDIKKINFLISFYFLIRLKTKDWFLSYKKKILYYKLKLFTKARGLYKN